MKNLDIAYINLDSRIAYFCSLNIDWLTFFDNLNIENINEFYVLSHDLELVDSSSFKETLLNLTFGQFRKIVKQDFKKEIVFFDFNLSDGIAVNYQTGEVSILFQEVETLRETCYTILKKAKYSVEETFQQLTQLNTYCFIEAPKYVKPSIQESTGELADF